MAVGNDWGASVGGPPPRWVECGPLHFKILTSPPASRKAKGRISDASPAKRGLAWTTRYELLEPMAALCHAQRVIRAQRHWLGSAITRLGCTFPRDHAASSESRFSFCICLTTAQKKSSMHAPAITLRKALQRSTRWYRTERWLGWRFPSALAQKYGRKVGTALACLCHCSDIPVR